MYSVPLTKPVIRYVELILDNDSTEYTVTVLSNENGSTNATGELKDFQYDVAIYLVF